MRTTNRRLGIVGKLMLVSVVLAAIPWLTLRYLHEMHDFVLEGQREALELAAQAVATVLHGREDLFAEQGGLPFSPFDDVGCSPVPLEAPVQLDGNSRDWPVGSEHTCRYQRAQSVWDEKDASVAFDLTLGQREEYLYALVQVVDDEVRLRHPRHRNLDGSDHLRITVPGGSRFVVTAQEPGALSAYAVGESWRYAQGDGLPERRVRGEWRPSASGYTVELRLPLDLLPLRQIGFEVADVDAGALERVVAASPGGRVHLVLLESPEIDRILRSLELPGAKISVVDERRRVRSELGTVPDAPGDPQRDRLIEVALARGAGTSESGEATTAASSPIRAGSRVVGAVLIEQANDDILALPRKALARERNAIIIACVVIAAIFWLFAWRLAWRIHRLSDEAGTAIAADGRVQQTELRAGRSAGDELGDLSRSVSGLLARLAHYTSFLERIPSTLRHEISNPLNTLSTSLQNLADEQPAVADSKYLKSAERGVARIGEIVESLTEAASFEEALRDDELELLDLAALVVGYVENVAATCASRRFEVHGADGGIPIRASGFRIEQLLDKLIDNAIAFSPEGGEIIVALEADSQSARIQVSNEGPLVDDDARAHVFDSMFSTRSAHLGIGLYIVRLTAEQLGGSAAVSNRNDGTGPVFEVDVPLAAAA